MNDEMKKLSDALWNEIVEAKFKWKLFEQLFAHSDARSSMLFSAANHFFVVLHNLLPESVAIAIARLVDTKHKVSLTRLVSFAENRVNHAIYETAVSSMEEVKQLSRPIVDRRHGIYAHRSLLTLESDPPPKIGEVTRLNVSRVLNKMGDLLNLVGGGLGLPKYPPEVVFATDGETLVRVIEKGKQTP